MDNTLPGQQDSVLNSFRGASGHDLELLRNQLHDREIRLPRDVMDHFRRLNTWTTSLRYRPGQIRTTDAKLIVDSAEEVLVWISRQ